MSDSQPTCVSRAMAILRPPSPPCVREGADRAHAIWMIPLTVVLSLCMASATPCRAQSNPQTARERVLLLRTGRVVQGQIQRISTGWLVTAKHGRVVVPTDQVRFDADSIEEVYLSLRLQLLREPTVGKHLNLADWCLTQKMLAEAALEVQAAMQLDPRNETARLMLKRLRAHAAREADATRTPTVADRDQVAEAGARVEVEQTQVITPTKVRSLAGLRPATAQQFVRAIQPILFNGCANAQCHSQTSKHEFRLERFRYGSGSHRLKSERNLAAILKYVDSKSPGRSRLLSAATDSHGGRTAFHGTSAAGQVESLKRWVHAAVSELYPRPTGQPSGQATVFADRSVASESVDNSPRSGPASRPGSPGLLTNTAAISASDNPPADVRSAGAEGSRVPLPRRARLRGFQDVLRETEAAAATGNNKKIDVFDPEEFNRRYAGRGSR